MSDSMNAQNAQIAQNAQNEQVVVAPEQVPSETVPNAVPEQAVPNAVPNTVSEIPNEEFAAVENVEDYYKFIKKHMDKLREIDIPADAQMGVSNLVSDLKHVISRILMQVGVLKVYTNLTPEIINEACVRQLNMYMNNNGKILYMHSEQDEGEEKKRYVFKDKTAVSVVVDAICNAINKEASSMKTYFDLAEYAHGIAHDVLKLNLDVNFTTPLFDQNSLFHMLYGKILDDTHLISRFIEDFMGIFIEVNRVCFDVLSNNPAPFGYADDFEKMIISRFECNGVINAITARSALSRNRINSDNIALADYLTTTKKQLSENQKTTITEALQTIMGYFHETYKFVGKTYLPLLPIVYNAVFSDISKAVGDAAIRTPQGIKFNEEFFNKFKNLDKNKADKLLTLVKFITLFNNLVLGLSVSPVSAKDLRESKPDNIPFYVNIKDKTPFDKTLGAFDQCIDPSRFVDQFGNNAGDANAGDASSGDIHKQVVNAVFEEMWPYELKDVDSYCEEFDDPICNRLKKIIPCYLIEETHIPSNVIPTLLEDSNKCAADGVTHKNMLIAETILTVACLSEVLGESTDDSNSELKKDILHILNHTCEVLEQYKTDSINQIRYMQFILPNVLRIMFIKYNISDVSQIYQTPVKATALNKKGFDSYLLMSQTKYGFNPRGFVCKHDELQSAEWLFNLFNTVYAEDSPNIDTFRYGDTIVTSTVGYIAMQSNYTLDQKLNACLWLELEYPEFYMSMFKHKCRPCATNRINPDKTRRFTIVRFIDKIGRINYVCGNTGSLVECPEDMVSSKLPDTLIGFTDKNAALKNRFFNLYYSYFRYVSAASTMKLTNSESKIFCIPDPNNHYVFKQQETTPITFSYSFLSDPKIFYRMNRNFYKFNRVNQGNQGT